MNISNAFPSNYVKASELQGKDCPVTIKEVKMEKVGDDQKPIVYFIGSDKGLVLNKTNANTIMAMYGGDTDMWTGKPIVLYAADVEFQGKMVQGIRVRPGQMGAAPAAPAAAPPASSNDLPDSEIPFAWIGALIPFMGLINAQDMFQMWL